MGFWIFMSLFNLFRNIKCKNRLVCYLSSISLLVYVLHENNFIRKFININYYEYIYYHYSYKHLIFNDIVLVFILLVISIVLATIYKFTIQKYIYTVLLPII